MYPNRFPQTQGTWLPSQNQPHQRGPPGAYCAYHHFLHYQQPRPYNSSGQTVNHFSFVNPGTYNVTMNIQDGHANREVGGNGGIRNPYQQATQNQSYNSIGHNNRNLNGRSIGMKSTGQFSTSGTPNQVSHLRTTGNQQQRTAPISTPSSGFSEYSLDTDNDSAFDEESFDNIDMLAMLMGMRRN